MKYKINKKLKDEILSPSFLITIIIILSAFVILFSYIAIKNAQPIQCDHVSYYDGQTICEVITSD